MTHRLHLLVWVVLAACLHTRYAVAAPGASLASKSVFRCTEGSRVVYADEPCVNRTGRMVDVADARTPAERRAAVANVRRDAAFAHDARVQRLADERRVANLGPAGIRMPVRVKDDDVKTKRHRGVGIRKAKKPKKVKFATSDASRALYIVSAE